MKEPFFKSKFTLIFKNKNTEASYHRALQPKIILFNKIMSFFMFAASFVSAMLIWDKKEIEERFNPQIIMIPNQIVAGLFFFSFILSLVINNIKFHIWIKYFIYVGMTFTFIFLRYYTRALAGVDMIAYTCVMNFEFILRIFFVILGIFCFCEIVIMSLIVCIAFFIYCFPIFGPLYFTVYIAYYSLLIIVIIISYYYVGEKKSSYFFKKKLEINNDWYNDVLENMNNGFLCIQNKNVSFVNRTLFELINRKFKGEKKEEVKETNAEEILINSRRHSSQDKNDIIKKNSEKKDSSGYMKRIDNPENYQGVPTTIENYLDKKALNDYCDQNSRNILNYLIDDEFFDSMKENNQKEKGNKDSQLWIGRLSSEEILEKLKENYIKTKFNESEEDRSNKEKVNNNLGKNILKNFVLLGNKKFEFKDEDEKIFEISYRYYSHYDDHSVEVNEHDNFEFVFNDVTRTKLIEEKNAEFKYNSLFLSKIAHEFKNPLICIAELVEQTFDDYINDKNNNFPFIKNKFVTKLKSIKSLSDYLLILIKDLDYFSQRQMDNKIEIVPSNIDLSEILNFTKNVGKSLLMKNGKSDLVKIKIEKSKEVPKKIITDEIRLKQILINLLSNAIKFTNRGLINLNISREEEKLKFVVSDTGIGMTSTQMENIFKPFKKGKDVKSINRYGSGLGLSIVYEMTHKLGSSIECLSKVGEGTKFWFSLPLILPSSTSNINQIIKHKSKSGIFPNEKSINILRPKSCQLVDCFDSQAEDKSNSNIKFKNKNAMDGRIPNNSELELLSCPKSLKDHSENFIRFSRNSSPEKLKSENDSIYSKDTHVLNTIYFRRPPIPNTQEIRHMDSLFSQRNQSNRVNINNLSTLNIFQSSNNLNNNIDSRSIFNIQNNTGMIDNRQINYINSRISNSQNNYNRINNNLIINNNNFKKEDYAINLNINKDSDFKTVIIVDDEKLTRESTLRIIRKICTQKGLKLNLLEADDGIECVYFFYKLINDGVKISGILSDQTMNYMKGSKAAQIIGEIAEAKGIPKIPYFILTAYEDTHTLNTLMNQYVNKIFTKPFTIINCEKFLDCFNTD